MTAKMAAGWQLPDPSAEDTNPNSSDLVRKSHIMQYRYGYRMFEFLCNDL